VITHDSTTVRYYLDGREIQKAEKSLSTGTGTLKIGGLGDPVTSFVGTMDELYMFDVALTAEQVQKLFNLR
jgi:hypothetical protein